MELTDLKFIFQTQNKSKVQELFNWRAPKENQIELNDLIATQDKLVLPIDLDKWQDIDTDERLEPLFKVLMKLTNPQGGNPVTMLNCIIEACDENNREVIITTDYYHGKNRVVGYFACGNGFTYQNQWDKIEISNEKYLKLKKLWKGAVTK